MEPLIVNRVLCAIDLSPSAESVLARAFTVAESHGATLQVLHVLDASPHALSLLTPRREQQLRYVQQMLENSRTDHAQVRARVAQGDPAAEILRFVREQSPDLVVLGGGRRPPNQAIKLGRTVRTVLRHCAAPLLIVSDLPRASADVRFTPEHIACALSSEPADWCHIEERALAGGATEEIGHTIRLGPNRLVTSTAGDGSVIDRRTVVSAVGETVCDVLVVPGRSPSRFAPRHADEGTAPEVLVA